MLCPHCGINFHDNWQEGMLIRDQTQLKAAERDQDGRHHWAYRTAMCPGAECSQPTIQIARRSAYQVVRGGWRQVYPINSTRGPVPKAVPSAIAEDYVEACNVLAISPKASAALSRRCLQNILRTNGYKSKDLAREIDLLLAESDPEKALPRRLRDTIDAIRNFGNFSAHPVNDLTSLQVIAVEPHEAEWCLEVLEEMFEHFYVGPAESAAKKAALNAKLKAGGKPAAK